MQLVLDNGGVASITPIPKAPIEQSDDLDIDKFETFAREINSSLLNLPKISKTKKKEAPKPSVVSDSDIIIVGDSNAAGLVFHGKYKGKLQWPRDYAQGLKGWSERGAIYVDPKTRQPLEPAIGAYTTGKILQKLKKFYEFKGSNYKPSIAIVHMGYNDHGQAPTSGFDNIQKTVNFLRSKGTSDVRVILTKGKGNPYGVNPNFEQDMKRLSDRLRTELRGAKIIPNNAKISNDGIHFFGYYDKLYADALRGATVSSTPTTSTASITNLPARARKYYPLFKKYSEKYNMNVALMMGICHRESDFRPNLVSHTKDYGLMQINRGNWESYGLTKDNVFDPETNIKTGVLFFSQVKNRDLPNLFRQRKSIIKWQDLSEEEKDRMALYAYNWGPWGLFKHRKFHKYKDINKFFADMANYYKNYSYIDKKTGKRKYVRLEDYSIKAIKFAKKYGYGGTAVISSPTSGTGSTGVAPATGAVAAPPEPLETDTQGLKTKLDNLQKVADVEELFSEISNLTGLTVGSAIGKAADMKRANSYLNKQNISDFIKQRISNLKSIHDNRLPTWKKQYKQEIAAADGNLEEIENINKKIAWFHRPVFYVIVEPHRLRRFFANSTVLSFGFEPNTNRISASYRGRETFYKQDTKNNSTYKNFLKELSLLKNASNTIISKIGELEVNADSSEEYKIKEFKEYMEPLNNVVNTVYSGLNDRGVETSRKAYLMSILNLALRAT